MQLQMPSSPLAATIILPSFAWEQHLSVGTFCKASDLPICTATLWVLSAQHLWDIAWPKLEGWWQRAQTWPSLSCPKEPRPGTGLCLQMQSLGVLVLPPVPAAPADLWSRNLSLDEKINTETCWSNRNGAERAGRRGLNTMSLGMMLSHTSPLFPWDSPTLNTRCHGSAVQQNDLHCFTASLGSLASAAFKPQLPEAHLKPSSTSQQNFVPWGNPQLRSSSLPFLGD